MDSTWIPLLIALGGYLIGTISTARIVFARLKPGAEPEPLVTPTADGQGALVSRAVGATSVMLAFGPRWGMLTTAIDMAKIFLPTLAVRLAFPNEKWHLVAAVAILVGHLWPVWHRFRGGGGNSCILGMLLAISPLGLVVTHAAGMLIGKVLPIFGFLGGVIFMVPWFAWRNGIRSPETVFAVTVLLLYIGRQIPEGIQIIRLKRAGHDLDMAHLMNLMKRSSATGRSGRSLLAESAAEQKSAGEPGMGPTRPGMGPTGPGGN